MLDIICLWIGRIIIGLLSLIVSLIGCYFILRLISIPLRKPWFFIKHLLPWYWVTEEIWKEYEKICEKIAKNPKDYEDWKIGIKVIRKGHLGIIIFPNKRDWWQPKNHLFIIKNN